MKKHLAAISIVLALCASGAAAQTINNLGAGRGSVVGTDLFPSYQGANPAVRPSAAQIAAYVYSLMSGDCTVTSSAITCTKLNGNTFPSSGTSGGIPYFSGANALNSSAALGANLPVVGGGAGVAPSTGTRSGNTTAFATVTGTLTNGRCVQIDASGNFVQASAACGTTETGANPTATAGPTAVNGSAGTFMRSDGAPAVQQGSSSQKGIVQVDGTTITESGGVISTAPLSVTFRIETGTNPALPSSDRTKLVFLSNASNQVPTIAQATGSFGAGWFATYCNVNAGTQTITATTSKIGGSGAASTFVLPAGTFLAPKCVTLVSDGTDYQIAPQGNQWAASTTWTGVNTFGTVIGTVTTQSGTTYTFASTDCGTTVRFSNGSAVTATIPQGLPIGCNIAVLQAGAGQVSVNGSAVTPATLQSAHSYTKTSGAGAVIGLLNDASNHVVLTGDGA